MENKSILVVDDEKDLREMMKRVLGDAYAVKDVENGFLALAEIKKKHYDLILLDIMMPGIDGVDVLRQAKTIDPAAKVIMMTGFAVEDKIRQSMGMGASAYIYKPFENDEIIKLVEATVSREF